MLVRIAGLLSTGELAEMWARLGGAPWADGRVTAGPQSALAKRNLQLPAEHPETLALQRIVLGALERNPAFFSAALPKRVFPPLFNRYAGELNAFGSHVDNAVRFLPSDRSTRVRTDLSATLFLSDASSYDGGELVIEDAAGEQAVKLDAGDLVLYPGTSVHRVEPVTRGERLASFFWIESMVRGNEERRLLYDMDRHLMHLRESVGEADPGVIGLTGTYHNLLRLWADV